MVPLLAFGGELTHMRTLASVVGRAARYLRARRARWTADTDRHFHDEIFERQDYDPFDPAYPGNIPIRRST
jgi:hypothetical protein